MASKTLVFNGFADLRLQWDGRWFEFKYNETQEVSDQQAIAPDMWQRNHPSDPQPNAVLERTYPADQFVRNLFERHHQNYITRGAIWIGDKEPSESTKARVRDRGRILKREVCEEAIAERRQAMAKHGKAPNLPEQIVDWMKELNIFDPTYNPQSQEDVMGNLQTLLQQAMNAPPRDSMKPVDPAQPIRI